MRDFIGKHVVDGSFDNRITVFLCNSNQMFEHIAGQALKSAVDPGNPRCGIVRERAAPEQIRLDVVTGPRAHIFHEAAENLGMPRFIPYLARHFELKFPRRLRKVE